MNGFQMVRKNAGDGKFCDSHLDSFKHPEGGVGHSLCMCDYFVAKTCTMTIKLTSSHSHNGQQIQCF